MKTIISFLTALAGVIFFILIMASAQQVFGQTNGAMAPDIYPVFVNINGITPVANGFICTTTSGSSSSYLATFQDAALTVPNRNPLTLNQSGRNVNGSTLEPIFLQGLTYRFTLYAAGTGNTCNGTAVGQLVWQQDNVYDLALLNPQILQVINCANESGGDAGAKIAACILALPSIGGVADARGLNGAQSISSSVGFGTKSVHLILATGTLTCTANPGPCFNAASSSGSIIEGQGMGATTLKLSVNGASADGIIPGANILIRNLTIQGNTTYTSGGESAIDGCACTNVEVVDVEIKNFGGHGLNSGGADANGEWNIHDSYIHDNHDDGVLLGGVGGHRVTKNLIWNNGSNGIDLNSPGNIISQNDVFNNGAIYAGGIDANGVLATSITASGSDGNIITTNQIHSNQGSQIKIRADLSGHTNGTLIGNNKISGGVAADPSVYIDTSVGVGCGSTNYTNIVGNSISTSANQGIAIGGGAGVPCIANGTSITSNILSSNVGISIQIAFGTGATLANNTYVGNGTDAPVLTSSHQTVESCERIGSTSSTCAFPSGALAFNTFQPFSGISTTFTTTGNTEFDITSSAVNTAHAALLLDTSNNFYVYDVTHSKPILTANSGSNLDATTSLSVGGGGAVTKSFVGLATLDFPSTNAQKSSDLTLAVTGVADQDPCFVGPPAASAGSDSAYTCFVSGADTVTVRYANYSSAPQDPGSGQFKVTLFHF